MVFLSNVEASRIYQGYGHEDKTEHLAILKMCKSSQWSSIENGTLMRIAIALESLVELFDPRLRREKDEAEQREAAYKSQVERLEARVELRMSRLKPFRLRYLSQLDAFLSSFHKNGHHRLANAIRHGWLKRLRNWTRHPRWCQNVLRIEPKNLHTISLYGIGPKLKAEWLAALEELGNDSTATEVVESPPADATPAD